MTASIALLLRATSGRSSAFTEHALGGDMRISHWLALTLIAGGEVDTSSALALRTGYDGGATTRLLDHLEKRGLISRRRSTSDRRMVHLAATDEGHALVAKHGPRVASAWDRLLCEFDAAEVELLRRLLQRLVCRLDAAGASTDWN